MADAREPVTLALLACLDIEIRPHELDLRSVRKAVYLPGYPGIVHELCIYWLVTNLSSGTHQFELCITDPDDNSVFPEPGPIWEVSVSDPLDQVDRFIELRGVRFPSRGVYLIQVKHDGIAVAQRRFGALLDQERPGWAV